MIELEIKRRNLHQWDLNQRVTIDHPAGTKVHFSTPWHSQDSIPVLIAYEDGGSVYADIPNLFLTKPGTISVYIFLEDGEGGYTEEKRVFNVEQKPKPDDYIYTETEVWTAEKAVAEALQEAKDSGDFKGDPGPKGDPGVVKFVVVTELPAEDTENAIYLLPNEGSPEGNLFDEYIFVDGKWEKIGSAAVAVNLEEYVKISDIDALVKDSVTTNTETLTDEEKAAACEWLGAVEKLPIATGYEKARVNCNRYNYSTKDYTLVVDEYRTATNWAIPVRNSKGGIYIPDAGVNDDGTIPTGELAVNKKYVDNGFVPKYEPAANNTTWLYAVRRYADGTVEHVPYQASGSVKADCIPVTGAGGALRVGTPTADQHATPKSYVDGRITANDDGTLTILLADGSKYKVTATKEE